jgi:hypothetical protein
LKSLILVGGQRVSSSDLTAALWLPSTKKAFVDSRFKQDFSLAGAKLLASMPKEGACQIAKN